MKVSRSIKQGLPLNAICKTVIFLLKNVLALMVIACTRSEYEISFMELKAKDIVFISHVPLATLCFVYLSYSDMGSLCKYYIHPYHSHHMIDV